MNLSFKAKAMMNLYMKGKVTKAALNKAVTDGVLTADERDYIVSLEA